MLLISPVGVWETKNGTHITIEKCADKICGFTDNRTQILYDFDENLKGMIKDPRNGKQYSSRIKIIDENNIEVAGCFIIFCKKQMWKKVK